VEQTDVADVATSGARAKPYARYGHAALAALTFAITLGIRVRDIDRHFWMLGDQIRDWSIALGPLTELPLVGPPTHVHGYTIGPAFYWILWIIRVGVGPWFHNLPHAGGIGQAMLQSAADALLLAAVWRRTGSVWLALATIVFVATAPFDLSVSALVWNPGAGAALAKIATALVLLRWPERSSVGVAATTVVAWCAVQCYTGTIFVAVGVFTALVASPLARRDWAIARRNAGIVAIVVLMLQVPYAVHQLSSRFTDSAMGAVTGSVGRIVAGREEPQLAKSWAGYTRSLNFILIYPWQLSWFVWVLIGCGAIVASRFRRDLSLLAVTLLPQLAAIVGYAFYVGDFLDTYYYLALMPAAVLTVTLSATALRPKWLAHTAAIALVAFALAVSPARIRAAATFLRMPEYGPLVDGSREIAQRGRPVRAISTEFTLPATSSTDFIYQILGGRIDRTSTAVGVIKQDGHGVYQEAGGL